MARQSSGAWYRQSKGTWYATVHGKRVSLGIQGKGNRKAAQDAFYRIMSAPVSRAPNSVPPEVKTATVKELADSFLSDAESRLKPNTVRIYRYDLDTFCETLGTKPAGELTAQHIGGWLMGRRTLSATTKAMTLRSISAMLGWAEKHDLLTRNVARKVTKPKSRSRSSEALISADVHGRLMAGASVDFRLVLRVLYGTGCRPSEVCRMTAENFNAGAKCVILAEHKSDHTGKNRVIFLPPELVDMLAIQVTRYGTGNLFRSYKGDPWTQRSVTEAMGRLQRKIGVKAIAYGYRHTYATDALAGGVPDATVAALLGHTSTAMLHKHYSHLGSRAEVLREASAKIR